ncbi:class I SAM-dependent methyltransferase [Eikenella halliae]|uniref:SAM-dependent methyltransferase n=1 Tax=Eikenella halliae TaxID=1795832 RepID=A0A1B6W0L7_9NEIS|nr:class I SAM-dependent methyltransferase [Eikenella halliae]OAM44167.1 SAM-dependent methyltransferase [Eikenella halliae]
MPPPLQSQFNAVSEQYDGQRRALIPCFDLFYQTAAELAAAVPNVRRVLDLGAGTGLMSAFVHTRCPQAEFILADLSVQMLAKARERFRGLPNVHFIEQDLARLAPDDRLPENGFDLIVSALAIHHLDNPQKQTLFRQIARLLAPRGRFINADQVLGETAAAETAYTEHWRRHVTAHPDLSAEAKAAAFERIKLDRMATLSGQFQWLAAAGLPPTLYFQHYNFVVLAADKP